MQKIIPHLWFDREAKEAAQFYVSVFGAGSKMKDVRVIHDTPSGDCDIASFELLGLEFMAISAGPLFKFNPSISVMVNFDPSQDSKVKKRIDVVWKKLMEGGKALMPLDKYPFSERYGWVQDKYGLSWQLILTNPAGEERPLVIPSLMFTRTMTGKAEEATDFYISVFKNSSYAQKETKRGAIARYPAGMEPDKESTVMFTDFKLEGIWFAAMDSGRMHTFGFNEAVSLIVNCKDQKEIDYFWKKLSADPQSEQCGWLKDKYGVSWQIQPLVLEKMMNDKDQKKVARVTEAFLKMKKFEIAKLEKAYAGK